MGKPYLTSREAAGQLGIGLSTLQRWAAQGIVTPAWRTPGGQARWDVDDLREQLRIRQPGAPADDASGMRPVVAAVVTSERGVLAGKRADGHPPWTFIAGEVEPGERPEDAAVREVKEETGLEVAAGRVIGRRVHPDTGRTLIYMAARPTHGTEVFVGDERELTEVRWLSLAEADELLTGMHAPVRAYLSRTIGRQARDGR